MYLAQDHANHDDVMTWYVFLLMLMSELLESLTDTMFSDTLVPRKYVIVFLEINSLSSGLIIVVNVC